MAKAFPSQTVRLDPDGPSPVLSVHVGFANVAQFRVEIWNAAAGVWEFLHEKPKVSAPDDYTFGLSPAELAGRHVKVAVFEESPTSDPNARFSTNLTVRQGEAIVDGGAFPQSDDKDTLYQMFFKSAA